MVYTLFLLNTMLTPQEFFLLTNIASLLLVIAVSLFLIYLKVGNHHPQKKR